MADLFGMESKREFFEKLGLGEGMNCPCCGRFAKVYRRRLHHGIAHALINLYRKSPSGYLHFSDFCTTLMGGDFTISRHWGLIEKKSSGFWRLTELGRSFVRDEAKVKKYVLLFDDQVAGFSGPDIGIHDCIGDRFNYIELLFICDAAQNIP